MAQKVIANVQLRGAAEAILLKDSVELQLDNVTPREVLLAVANQNPLLARQIVRSDGTPRLSTKILIDGQPPSSIDEVLKPGASIVLLPSMPCDG